MDKWKRKLGAWRLYNNGKQAKIVKITKERNVAGILETPKLVKKVYFCLRVRNLQGHWHLIQQDKMNYPRLEIAKTRGEKELNILWR